MATPFALALLQYHQKNKTMFKYLFKRDTIFATIAVFLVMGMFSLLPINTHFLDPIHLALSDFDYNDMAYSQLHKNENTPMDTNIVIINIGQADRLSIASMIGTAAAQQPKAIGVDAVFYGEKDPVGDDSLATLFLNTDQLVGAYNYGDKNKGYFYNGTKNKGFSNFVGEEGGVVRHFTPFLKEEKLESFAASIVKIADPKSYAVLQDRDKTTEIVNYTRKANKYLVIDGMELIANKAIASTLTNKIVLIGYVGSSSYDVEDKHFTPLNTKFTGKALPDLNGVFIHANIISMILNQNYVHHLPSWLMWSIAALLCWLHMAIFTKAYLDVHIWFHLVAKIAQIISAVCFVYIGLWCFYEFDVKMNLTATLVAIVLAVDVLYFYEAFATWLHKKIGYRTIFTHHHG